MRKIFVVELSSTIDKKSQVLYFQELTIANPINYLDQSKTGSVEDHCC